MSRRDALLLSAVALVSAVSSSAQEARPYAANSRCTAESTPHNEHSRLPEFETQPPSYPLSSLADAIVGEVREDLASGCHEFALHHFFGSTRRPWFPAFTAYFTADADSATTAILFGQEDVGLPGENGPRHLSDQEYIWAIVFSDRPFGPRTWDSARADVRRETLIDGTVIEADSALAIRLIPTSRGHDHALPALLSFTAGRSAPSVPEDAEAQELQASIFKVGEHESIPLYVAIVQLELENDVDYQISVTPRFHRKETPKARAAYGWFRNKDQRLVEVAAAAGGSAEPFRPGLFALIHLNVLDIGGDVLRSRWPQTLSLTTGGSIIGPDDRKVFEDIVFGVSLGHIHGSAGIIVGVSRVSIKPVAPATVRVIEWNPFFGIDFRF